jgi:hypothetical protein
MEELPLFARRAQCPRQVISQYKKAAKKACGIKKPTQSANQC